MKSLVLAIVLAVAAASPALAQSSGRQLPPGKWLETCSQGRWQDQNVVLATCPKKGGEPRYTSFDMRNCNGGALTQDNGHLKCDTAGGGGQGVVDAPASRDAKHAMPGGTWTNSCRKAYMTGNILRTECLDTSNRWRETSIDMRNCRSGIMTAHDAQLRCP
jgi:hypothetical protein